MDPDNQLKDTLALTVSNAISRMETLRNPADRRSIFNEYKEWLEQDVDDEVWALPTNRNHEKQL